MTWVRMNASSQTRATAATKVEDEATRSCYGSQVERARPIVGWLLVLGVIGCSSEDPCPEGARSDTARAARLQRALERTTLGSELWARARADERSICFAEVELGTVSSTGPIVLPQAVGDAENAARLGHLLDHVVRGPPFPDRVEPSASCAALVDAGVRAEAAAHVLELGLRRELGVEAPQAPFPFESELRGAPKAQWEALVVGYMLEHADGEPGLPGFASTFARRCEAARR